MPTPSRWSTAQSDLMICNCAVVEIVVVGFADADEVGVEQPLDHVAIGKRSAFARQVDSHDR